MSDRIAQELGRPFWWEGLPDAVPEGDLPERCDLLVIGGGYTGLSAAIAAHDCGARVVVVDAGLPGRGASTRNGGMFGAQPRLGWDVLVQRYGEAVARGGFEEASTSLTWALGLIAAEGIDCDLQACGRIALAWTARHLEGYRETVRSLTARSSVQAELVEREDLGAHIRTEQYFGGMFLPQHCAIQPRKFHDGLLAAVQRRGIPVVAQCPVTRLERVGGFAAETPRGRILAERVVLATGGYTTRAFRWHQARVFPLPSYIIATEELSPDLIAHIAPGRRNMVESRARHSYFRVSPDGKRILYGGRAAMVGIDLRRAAANLRGTMVEVWPELEGARITHGWTGNTGYSFGHMPQVGVYNGVHFAMGFSGSGTVMAPYLGAKAAYRALGDARGETAFSGTTLRPHVMHPTPRPHFLRAADLWYRNYVDRREGAGARVIGRGRRL
ncbi:FAD-binding oxidoreductase [Alphaproteobacteria bacterium KMM 3653]|uniref:FAD-binding oxidoreductase n=1 Tax=Harenicola maris TaxID=2841044 RepID=A0AAP2CLI0_9RHOB|nr:FAD-binding oxidoreductase [Harenicola maris]